MRSLINSLRPIQIAVLVFTAGLPALAPAQSAPEDLRITLGKSIVIDYPTDIGRISTSNPEIVDAVAVSTREILLHAKSHGVSTVVVWAKAGQRTFYNLSVEHNLEPMRKLLGETFPSENIQVQSARDSVTLIGSVSSQAVADRAAALVASLAKTVVNNLQVVATPAERQIMLRVKFAELNRNVQQDFGVNLLSTGALNTPGLVTTGQFSAPRINEVTGAIPGSLAGSASTFSLGDALNIFAFRPDLNLGATIRALQSEGILQILAEPNLVTTNGKEASFLVGGEFPVPILQGGSNAGAVTVQFREFGIRLTFTPAITPHNTIRLFVRPEVSTIDLANAVTVSGFRIPALATRRMETNIELGVGQSFVIGGLVDDRVTDSMSRIPGLSNIPLLGVLFKSRTESKAKTELIVMVTPEIVEPLNAADAKPVPIWPKEFLAPAGKPARNANGPKTSSKHSPKNDDGSPSITGAAQPDKQLYVVKLDEQTVQANGAPTAAASSSVEPVSGGQPEASGATSPSSSESAIAAGDAGVPTTDDTETKGDSKPTAGTEGAPAPTPAGDDGSTKDVDVSKNLPKDKQEATPAPER
jgi:pilus assembly protein CpaC